MTPGPAAGARALVTGASGFVGVHACRTFAEAGAEVHGVVRPGGRAWRVPEVRKHATVHEVDLAEHTAVRDLLGRVGPTAVVHAAAADAYAAGGAREVVRDTLLTLANVLDAAAEVGKPRIVVLGSSLAYGPSADAHREDAPLRPRSLRGAGAAAKSLLAREMAKELGLPLVELRLFSVYGPWEPWHRLVPSVLRAALLGKMLPLAPPGARRDFVFVGDVAEACLLAATAEGAVGKVVNVGSGVERSNEELVAAVEAASGRPVRVEPGAYPPRPTDTPHWRADVTAAEELLGWRPRHGLVEGLAATLPWVEAEIRRRSG